MSLQWPKKMEFAFLRSWMEHILTNPSQSDFTEQAEDQL